MGSKIYLFIFFGFLSFSLNFSCQDSTLLGKKSETSLSGNAEKDKKEINNDVPSDMISSEGQGEGEDEDEGEGEGDVSGFQPPDLQPPVGDMTSDQKEDYVGCYKINFYFYYQKLNDTVRHHCISSLEQKNITDWLDLSLLCMITGDDKAYGALAEKPTALRIVGGSVSKWKITVKEGTKYQPDPHVKKIDLSMLPMTNTLNADLYKVANHQNTYDVPFKDFMPNIPKKWTYNSMYVNVLGVDSSGSPVGNLCEFDFMVQSPLVLYFGNDKEMKTIHPFNSKVKFDLNSDGFKENTGWIFPDSAFLALDLNGNGLIDNGKELFGEQTILKNGKRAQNGYLALSDYDLLHKGYINSKDKIFSKLLLWFDKNIDGISQKDEIKTLKQMNITRINTTYTKNLKKSVAHMDNLLPFKSRFFGPDRCDTKGCLTYDVFFGNIINITKNN